MERPPIFSEAPNLMTPRCVRKITHLAGFSQFSRQAKTHMEFTLENAQEPPTCALMITAASLTMSQSLTD